MLAKRQAALIYGSTGHVHAKSGFEISRLNCLEGESINSYWIFLRWLRFLAWKLSLYFSCYVLPLMGFTCILCKAQL